MTDGQQDLKNRLEAMLRRWGADEAARTTPIGKAPVRSRRQAVLGALWRRWGPLAAAAVLLVAAVAFFAASRSAGPRSAKPSAAVDADRNALAEKLAALQAQHKATLEALVQARNQLEGHAEKTRSIQAECEAAKQNERRAQEQLNAAAERLDDLNGKMLLAGEAARKAGLAREAKEAEVARLGRALQDAEKLCKDAEGKVLAAAEEAEACRKLRDAAVADKRTLENELALVKVHRGAMMRHFQQAYLGLMLEQDKVLREEEMEPASLDAAGLRARQEVARRSRLIERCARIRSTVQDESTRRLLDKLEVILTRLELLDPKAPSAAQTFASMVLQEDISGQIDKALAEGMEVSGVRAWLFEALLVLTGADRVG